MPEKQWYRFDTIYSLRYFFRLVKQVSIRYHLAMHLLELHNTLERLSNLMRNEMRREGARFGLQPIQLEALHYLAICNRFSDTPKAVTDYLGQTKGTVSQSLKVLERQEFIKKELDQHDKRVTHLKMTPSGQAVIDATIPGEIWQNLANKKLLPDSQQASILQRLKELLLALQKANQFKTFGACKSCHYNQKTDHGYHCQLTNETLQPEEIERICIEHEAPKKDQS